MFSFKHTHVPKDVTKVSFPAPGPYLKYVVGIKAKGDYFINADSFLSSVVSRSCPDGKYASHFFYPPIPLCVSFFYKKSHFTKKKSLMMR